MRLWQDGILALLASIGLSTILWMVLRPLLFLPDSVRRASVVLCARGDGDDLEQQILALAPLRGVIGEILLVNCGLSEEGLHLCHLLERSDRRVTLCKIDEIEKYIS